MAYIYYNPNPRGKRVGDCVIRAISKNLEQPWIATFITLMRKAIERKYVLMSLTDNGSLSAADVAVVMGANNGGFDSVIEYYSENYAEVLHLHELCKSEVK